MVKARLPLDEWCSTEAFKLTNEIDCHLREMLEGVLDEAAFVSDDFCDEQEEFYYSLRRLIMGSVRDALEDRQKSE